MSKPFTFDDAAEWPLSRIIAYMEATPDESWTTDVVRTKDGKNCFYGHLHALGGGDNQHGGSQLWDYFEECYATTYMLYPVNDGENPKYPQASAKHRVIVYLKDLELGKEKTTHQLMAEDEQALRDKLATSGE